MVGKREIPSKSLADLYLCESFYKFTNTLIPNKFPSLDGDHPRLLIPFRDEQGEIFAYQGRAFGNEQPKYITIKFDETKQKIYGLDRIDDSKEIYVVEGPIDSMFLDNCIAVGGSDFSKPLVIAGKIVDNIILVPDNEPRNKEIVNRMIKAVDKKFNVAVWPESLKHKDINDMILSGKSASQVQKLITDNTFSGAAAKLRFAEWRKINA